MIAQIDYGSTGYERDITAFLSEEEIQKLPSETIEGVLVKLHKPKQQGILKIRCDQNAVPSIHVDGKQDKYEITLNSFECQKFRKERLLSIGYDAAGDKVNLYERSMAEWTAGHLEFYRDNKNNLPAEFG